MFFNTESIRINEIDLEINNEFENYIFEKMKSTKGLIATSRYLS